MVSTTIDNFVGAIPHFTTSESTMSYLSRLAERMGVSLKEIHDTVHDDHLGATVALRYGENLIGYGASIGEITLRRSMSKALDRALGNLFIRLGQQPDLEAEVNYFVSELERFTDGFYVLNDGNIAALREGGLLDSEHEIAGIKIVATLPNEYANGSPGKRRRNGLRVTEHPSFTSRVVVSPPYLFNPERKITDPADEIFSGLLGNFVKKRTVEGRYMIPVFAVPYKG